MVSAAPPSPAPAQPRFSCVPRPSLGDQHHEGDAPVLVQAVLWLWRSRGSEHWEAGSCLVAAPSEQPAPAPFGQCLHTAGSATWGQERDSVLPRGRMGVLCIPGKG